MPFARHGRKIRTGQVARQTGGDPVVQGGEPLPCDGADGQGFTAGGRSHPSEVGLGQDHQIVGPGERRCRPLGITRGQNPQPKIGLFGAHPRPTHALGLDQVLTLPQSGGVRQGDRITADDQVGVEDVAGGAGDRGDDGGLARDQGVEQRGLAGVGLADQDNAIAFTNPFSPARVGQRGPQVGDQAIQYGPGRAGQVVGDLLIRKIDLGLDQGHRLEQVAAETGVGLAQGPVQLTERLGGLGRGLGVNQIGDSLGLGQIHPAVLERPAGEFTRIGRAKTKGDQGLARGLDHGATAVEVKFGAVLASIAVRGRKTQNQRLINGPASVGQGAQGREAWFQAAGTEGRQGCGGVRAGQAEDGDGPPAGRGGEGEDGVGHLSTPPLWGGGAPRQRRDGGG